MDNITPKRIDKPHDGIIVLHLSWITITHKCIPSLIVCIYWNNIAPKFLVLSFESNTYHMPVCGQLHRPTILITSCLITPSAIPSDKCQKPNVHFRILSAQAGIEPAPSILPFSMDVLHRLNYCADHFSNNNNAQSSIYRNVGKF